MELKRFLIYYLDLFIILIVLTYILFSFNSLSMPVFPENNSFLYGSQNLSYQFFENMRFRNSNISFSINECNSFQRTHFINALKILENNTILNFYEIKDNSELELFCEDRLVKDGNFIIAGEGGPVLIKKSGEFHIIEKGQALLRKESNCASPNTALHEILHAFGFVHSLNPSNIMYKQSYCSQDFSPDIISEIEKIYSINSYPDLKLKNSFSILERNILELNITIENVGLEKSFQTNLTIYINGKNFKSFVIPALDVGENLNFNIKNLYVDTKIKNLRIEIEELEKELDFANNEYILI
jgi:hypothetical protein